MESSTVLAFRIFVMLSCLIVVPMAAIFGSAFPDVVKTVLVDRIVAWSTGKTPEPAKPADPAAPPAPLAAGANNWEAPRWGGQAEAGAWQPNAEAPSAVIPAVAATTTPQGGNQSASFADPQRAVPPQPLVEGVGQPLNGAYPRAGNNVPGVGPAAPLATPTAPAATHPGETQDFESMGRKLRQYGAVYYLLETYGNQGQLYRFHCSMALANNPNYTRYFEATDADSLRAMSQVLEKVEAWRAGRLQ